MRIDTLRSFVGRMREDISIANSSFEMACKNLSVLSMPPIPAELIVSMGDQIGKNLGLKDTTIFSFPSLHTYNYPEANLVLSEARRTYTTKPHSTFRDQVVGLHLFAKNDISSQLTADYYFAISTFQPQQEPFPLLNKAQTDLDFDPHNIIDFYRLMTPWHRFKPELVPADISPEVVAALKRVQLL